VNSSLALSLDFDLGSTAGDGVVGALGLPTERSAKRRLSPSGDDVLRSISVILDEMIEVAIAKRTAEDFAGAVSAALPRYMQLVLAFGQIVQTLTPRDTLLRLAEESLNELEADIREHGMASFGSDMCERGVFTVWTLRKISDLAGLLAEKRNDVNEGDREKEARFASEFLVHALRARFHIDCLTASMRTKQPLYPEVLPLIDDGLRSAVNAYAWVKQAVDLRFPTDESQPLADYWTEDDDVLLDASMRDLREQGND
jgi:hypothetical protein